MKLTESDLHRIINESVKIILCENSGLNQFEESPLWGNGCGDYEKDIAHKRKVYKYLSKLYGKIMNNLKCIGVEDEIAYKVLMPLQDEIKSHEEY